MGHAVTDLPAIAPAKSVSSVERSWILREFANRLRTRMIELGWNQSDLARAASKYMPNGRMGRDNISNYVRADNWPTPIQLYAVAKAVEMEPSELFPSSGMPTIAPSPLPTDIAIADGGNGMARIRIDQLVTWEVALQIAGILKPKGTEN